MSTTVGCRSDSECPPSESCVNKECVDPCRYTQCGTGATCVVVGGKARCRCPPGYFGDSLVRCERPQCTSDSECPSQLACRNLRCQNPCSCATDALCTVTAHVPTCRCPPGYIGNPHQTCSIGKLLDNIFPWIYKSNFYAWKPLHNGTLDFRAGDYKRFT